MHPFPPPSQQLSFNSLYLVIKAFVVFSYICLVSTSGTSASFSKRKYILLLLRARERKFNTSFSLLFFQLAVSFPSKTHHSPVLDPNYPTQPANTPFFFPLFPLQNCYPKMHVSKLFHFLNMHVILPWLLFWRNSLMLSQVVNLCFLLLSLYYLEWYSIWRGERVLLLSKLW